jgi:protein TonB
MARRRGYEGTVVLAVLVNAQGKVEDSRVRRSCGHDILDEAALKAVQNWLFEPGKRGNRPVSMWVNVPIRFQLR